MTLALALALAAVALVAGGALAGGALVRGRRRSRAAPEPLAPAVVVVDERAGAGDVETAYRLAVALGGREEPHRQHPQRPARRPAGPLLAAPPTQPMTTYVKGA